MVQAVVHHRRLHPIVCIVAVMAGLGCPPPHEPEGTEADQVGVAAQCQADVDCEVEADSDGYELECLTNFKGGYCGIVDCQGHEDCPQGAACVAHDDGRQYCFRICRDKAECNLNRDVDHEANCSANIAWVGDDVGKACVPPSGA